MYSERENILDLYYYTSDSGKNLILEYIDSLSLEEQVDGYSVIECMQNNKMEEVHTKKWSKKVYEAYFYKHNRLFYIIVNGDDIYLLHACKKQKNKTVKKDKKIVEKRAKELGAALGKKFI